MKNHSKKDNPEKRHLKKDICIKTKKFIQNEKNKRSQKRLANETIIKRKNSSTKNTNEFKKWLIKEANCKTNRSIKEEEQKNKAKDWFTLKRASKNEKSFKKENLGKNDI
jgi:hypothetical protein